MIRIPINFKWSYSLELCCTGLVIPHTHWPLQRIILVHGRHASNPTTARLGPAFGMKGNHTKDVRISTAALGFISQPVDQAIPQLNRHSDVTIHKFQLEPPPSSFEKMKSLPTPRILEKLQITFLTETWLLFNLEWGDLWFTGMWTLSYEMASFLWPNWERRCVWRQVDMELENRGMSL